MATKTTACGSGSGSAAPTEVVRGETATCQGIDGIACKDHHKSPIGRFPSFKFILAHLPALLLVDLAIVVALSRSGLLDTPRFESLNVAVLDRVNALLPTINASIDSLAHLMAASDRKSVGQTLAEQGAFVKHPIVMIPGFVSSGLEVWTGKDCAKGFFRQRLWAALSGARTFFVERDCWKEHMMLDPWTGGDPPGIRLRASEGFGATDYFIANYWVWSKLVENLAAVGYTPSNMAMQAYDWRLSFSLLEARDGYFTTLKGRVEAMHKTSGRKVALISHSMGSLVAHHFFRWVTTIEERGGGGGGKRWVDEHIECFINIAGPHLGVPKAATALLSGEMSDTVLGGPMTSLVEGFFGRRMRRELWSSWGSLWAMLPVGGNALWGPGVDFCLARSSEDPHCPEEKDSFSPLVAMTDMVAHNDSGTFHELDKDGAPTAVAQSSSRSSHSVVDVLNFLIQFGNGRGPTTFNSLVYSPFNKSAVRGAAWHDATSTPLPHAPSMKIFCLYGVGLETERAYSYKFNWDEPVPLATRRLAEPAMVIDPINDEKNGIRHGIRYSDGDGSVPLLSLAYVCVDAWKRDGSGLNPSKSKVFTREYLHQSQFSADDPMRGGPLASDHVGILGNADMMEDIIKVVTDFRAKEVTQDRIVSDIPQIAANVNSHRLGGLSRQQSPGVNSYVVALFSSIRSAVQQATPQHVAVMWSRR